MMARSLRQRAENDPHLLVRDPRVPSVEPGAHDGGRLVVSGVPADHSEREIPGVADIDDRQ
jgi:hypothetical protein